jgi:hypothetical protein
MIGFLDVSPNQKIHICVILNRREANLHPLLLGPTPRADAHPDAPRRLFTVWLVGAARTLGWNPDRSDVVPVCSCGSVHKMHPDPGTDHCVQRVLITLER